MCKAKIYRLYLHCKEHTHTFSHTQTLSLTLSKKILDPQLKSSLTFPDEKAEHRLMRSRSSLQQQQQHESKKSKRDDATDSSSSEKSLGVFSSSLDCRRKSNKANADFDMCRPSVLLTESRLLYLNYICCCSPIRSITATQWGISMQAGYSGAFLP